MTTTKSSPWLLHCIIYFRKWEFLGKLNANAKLFRFKFDGISVCMLVCVKSKISKLKFCLLNSEWKKWNDWIEKKSFRITLWIHWYRRKRHRIDKLFVYVWEKGNKKSFFSRIEYWCDDNDDVNFWFYTICLFLRKFQYAR